MPMILHKNNNGLLERLTTCVERVGGKRAMSVAAMVSEAQLFRYLNGKTDVTSDKLLAIAKAAKVEPNWLLTGEGEPVSVVDKDLRPAFRSELMVQIVQLFEELLIEFEKPFNPRQRARAITFLYNALRHEETKRGVLTEPKKFDLLKSVNYLAELRTEEELEVLIRALTLLEYSPSENSFTRDDLDLLRIWCNLVVRGVKGYYSSYVGQVYYERVAGGQLEASVVLSLQNLVVEACKLTKKTSLDWLDLGCGNGRHLIHLAKHMPNLNLRGIEISPLGFSHCKEFMDSGKLPKDSVVAGDVRQLPFASNSFDVIYSNLSLYCLPYIPNTQLGLEEAMSEIERVLRPNGVASIVFPLGNWRDYSRPHQYMDKDSIASLVTPFSFKVLSATVEQDDAPTSRDADNSQIPNTIKFNHQKYLSVLIQKK